MGGIIGFRPVLSEYLKLLEAKQLPDEKPGQSSYRWIMKRYLTGKVRELDIPMEGFSQLNLISREKGRNHPINTPLFVVYHQWSTHVFHVFCYERVEKPSTYLLYTLRN